MNQIRRAAPADAPALTRIYNEYIENTVITFEVASVSDPELAQRIESLLPNCEWLVSMRAGSTSVLGS